jgi:hypothetical protein
VLYTIRQTSSITELERWDATTLDQVKAQYRYEMREAPPLDLRVLDHSDAAFTLVTRGEDPEALVPSRLTPVEAWDVLQHGVIDLNTHEAGWSMVTTGNEYAWLLYLPVEKATAWVRQNDCSFQ